jgi:hypothetical protein
MMSPGSRIAIGVTALICGWGFRLSAMNPEGVAARPIVFHILTLLCVMTVIVCFFPNIHSIMRRMTSSFVRAIPAIALSPSAAKSAQSPSKVAVRRAAETTMNKAIAFSLRFPFVVLALLAMTYTLLTPSLDVRCRHNSAKAAVCQVTESRLGLKYQRNFYPILASYNVSYHAATRRNSSYWSYQMIFRDASARQLRVGEPSRDEAVIEATVDQAANFLAAKSPSYMWRDDVGVSVRQWVIVLFSVLVITANLWFELRLPTEKRHAA